MVHSVYLWSQCQFGVAGKASRDFDKNTNNNLEWVTNFSHASRIIKSVQWWGIATIMGVSSGMGAGKLGLLFRRIDV